MSQRPASAPWLLVPFVSLGSALVGAVVIFYGSVALADVIPLGERGLGVGVWLLVTGFGVLVVSLFAGVVVGLAKREIIGRPSAAVRQGLAVGGLCTLGYLLAAVVIWSWPAF